jgi:integrase
MTNLEKFDKTFNMTFDKINDLQFFYAFRNYSITKLNHIDNTISKNAAIIKSFFRYLQDNEIFTFKSRLFSFKVDKNPAQVVTLTADEIREIYYCDKYDKFERQLIDVFVFLCVTSIRYSDYEQLDKAIVENNMLKKVNEKTKTDIIVPLNQTALDILQKYDNHLPQFTNAYFNRELKEIFKQHKLLETPYKKTSIQDRKPVVKSGFKRQFITVHKSRSSFITILISNNTPLNEIMAVTGHKKISTLNFYTDKRVNPNVTNCITI